MSQKDGKPHLYALLRRTARQRRSQVLREREQYEAALRRIQKHAALAAKENRR